MLREKLRKIHTKWETTKTKKEWRVEIARKSALFYFSKRSPIDKLMLNLQSVKMTILLRQQLLTNHLHSEFDNGHIIQQLDAMDKKLSRLESAQFEDEDSPHNNQHLTLTRTNSTKQQYGLQEEERFRLSDALSVNLEPQTEKRFKQSKILKLRRIFSRKGKRGLMSQSEKSFSSIVPSIESHDGIPDSNASDGNRVSFTVTQQELGGILELVRPSSTLPPSPNEDSTAHFNEERPEAQVTSHSEEKYEIEDTFGPLPLLAIAKEVFVPAGSHDLDITRNEDKGENPTQDGERTKADYHGSTRYRPPSVEAVQELDSSPANPMDDAPWLLEPTETLQSTDSSTVESRDETLMNEPPQTLSSLQDTPKESICQNDNSTTPRQRQQHTNQNDFNPETPSPETLQTPSGRQKCYHGCSCRYGSCPLHNHGEDSTWDPEGFRNLRNDIGDMAKYIINENAGEIGESVADIIKGNFSIDPELANFPTTKWFRRVFSDTTSS